MLGLYGLLVGCFGWLGFRFDCRKTDRYHHSHKKNSIELVSCNGSSEKIYNFFEERTLTRYSYAVFKIMARWWLFLILNRLYDSGVGVIEGAKTVWSFSIRFCSYILKGGYPYFGDSFTVTIIRIKATTTFSFVVLISSARIAAIYFLDYHFSLLGVWRSLVEGTAHA